MCVALQCSRCFGGDDQREDKRMSVAAKLPQWARHCGAPGDATWHV